MRSVKTYHQWYAYHRFKNAVLEHSSHKSKCSLTESWVTSRRRFNRKFTMSRAGRASGIDLKRLTVTKTKDSVRIAANTTEIRTKHLQIKNMERGRYSDPHSAYSHTETVMKFLKSVSNGLLAYLLLTKT